MAKSDGQIELSLNIKATYEKISAQLKQLAERLSIKVTGKLDVPKTKKQINADLSTIKPTNVTVGAKINKTEAKKQLKADLKSLDGTSKIKINADVDVNKLKKQLKNVTPVSMKSGIDIDGAENLEKVSDGMDSINKKSATTVASITLMHRALNGLEQAARKIITTSSEMDEKLTDLRMVTGDSYETAAALTREYNLLAQELGATTGEVMDASSEWLRQGKSIEETTELIGQSMILSKVGAMDSATATERLTSALNGYKLEASDAASLVDKFTSVDMAAAVSADELAEALSHTASSAHLAGLSIDQIISYITVVAETTRKSASVVGESFKSVLARLQKVTNGDAVDDFGDDISKVETTLRSLGIELRSSETEFRNIFDVIDEVGRKFNGLDSVVQRQIVTAMGGVYQSENLLALLTNYDKVAKYIDISANSAGTAENKFNAYQDSIKAHYNAMVAAAESLAMNTATADFMKTVLDATAALLEFIDNTHLLQISLSTLAAAGTVKLFSTIGDKLKDTYKTVSQLSTAFNILGQTSKSSLSAAQFEKLLDATKGLNASQLRLIITQKNLTNEQRIQLLMASGLTQQEAQQTLATLGLATAEGTATAATFSLSGAFKALGAAIAANPIGFIVTVLTAAISIISSIVSELEQKEEEQRQAAIEAGNAAAEEAEEISNLAIKYLDLTEAIDDGTATKKDALTASEELTDALDLEKEKVNELIAKYGDYKTAIIAATREKLATDISTATQGANAAKDQSVSDLKTGWLWGNEKFFSSIGEEAGKAMAYLEGLGFEGIDNTGSMGGGTMFLPSVYLTGGDTAKASFDDLLADYKYLESAMNAVREKFGSDNPVFKELVTLYNKYSESLTPAIESIEKANSTIASDLILAERQINDPKTKEEFENFRDSIIENLNSHIDFTDVGSSAESIVDELLGSNNTYKDWLAQLREDEITAIEIEQKRKDIAELLTPKDYEKYTEGTSAHFHAIDEYTMKLEEYKDKLKDFSSEDLSLAFDLLSVPDNNIDSWDALIAAMNAYKTNSDSIISISGKIQSVLSSLWNSEDFTDTKESIVEMASSLDGITVKNIEELAEESAELATILELDGMNAQFLAKVLQTEIESGNGFALITDDALLLNDALNGMVKSFDDVTEAKSRYDAAMSVDEKDTNFKSYADAFKKLNDEFVAGTVNSNAFWAASEFLFGSDQLAEWGWSDGIDEIYEAMKNCVGIFEDADSAGSGFLDKLYELSEAGKLVNENGEKLVEITKDSEGAFDFNIDYENIDLIAEKMNLTREAILACLEALSIWGEINFTDLTEVMDAIDKIGLSAENAGNKAVNVSALADQLITLGKTDKEIYEILSSLKDLDGVVLLDINTSIENLTQSLTDLGIAADDGVSININTDGLADLLSEMNFTKDEAEKLITKLGEADGISLTNAKGEVQEVSDALAYIDTLDFATVEEKVGDVETALDKVDESTTDNAVSEIENIGSAAQNAKKDVDSIATAMNKVNGTTATVTIDVKRKGGLLSLLGFAKGTKNAPDGAALLGEEGVEIVKSGNRAYLAGVHGAEIVDLDKGDIVYTANETRQILSSGKVIHGSIPAYSGGYNGGASGKIKTGTKDTYQSVIDVAADVEVTDVNVEDKSLEDALEDTLKEMDDEISKKISAYEHQIFLNEKNNKDTTEQIAIYRKMQEEVHDMAERYRTLGLSENSDYIMNLQKQWWDYQDSIQEIVTSGYEDFVKDKENSITLLENWLDNAVADNDYSAIKQYTNDIVNYYKEMQEAIHEQAEYYRSLGYSDTSDEVSKLSDIWWDYQDSILNTVTDTFAKMVDTAHNAVDEIQSVYSTLTDAAQEYADSGFITVDTLQDILKLGVQYLAFLTDENGKLIINEQSIQRVIAARTQQLAVESSLNYIEQLRTAITNNDTIALQNLLFATDAATDSTWGLVYAQLASLDLTEDQYSAALQRINTLRSLADTAVTSIGQKTGQIAEQTQKALEDQKKLLEEQKQALDDILGYVEDMIKQEVENHIDALEDEIDSYKKIVDLQKDSLKLAKEKDEYEKDVKDKVSDIAKLEARIQQLSLDDSREAQAEKIGLEEELAELQQGLADKQSDHAYDVTNDMLDNMADAYEQEKNDEIEILKDSISSQEKIYQLAIARINNNWDSLYQDLINWNTQYGSNTNQEISSAWASASQAVQQYGSYLNAVASTQAALNAMTDASSSSYSGSGSLGNTGNYSSDVAKGEQIGKIVKQMKANSASWNSSDDATKQALSDENVRLAAELQALIGKKLVRGQDGVWYIGSVGGTHLYDVYHKGGIVGGKSSLKDNETMAVLENGEMVLDSGQKKSVFTIVENTKDYLNTLKDITSAIFGNGTLNNANAKLNSIVKDGAVQASNQISAEGNRSVAIDASIVIHGDVDKNMWDKVYPVLKDHPKQVAEVVNRETLEVFHKRGIFKKR